MLIIQFNDCIVQTSLNIDQFKIICEPADMVRRHLVRGYNEKVYFAETSGSSETIKELEFHMHKPNEVIKREIFQLAGAWLVAFEADPDHIQDDLKEDACVQSLYIMDDHQKIQKLRNEDGVKFEVEHTYDFSHHKKLKEIHKLRDNDWAHVHITDRSLSFGDQTYNLHSTLSVGFTIPSHTFGMPKKERTYDDDDEEKNEEEDDEDEDEGDKQEEVEKDWDIQSVQAMSMTANVIALAMRAHSEFCFIVKPAPGSRRVNIVGYQQVSELKQMIFVTNVHVLLKFNGGKAVTLLSNGCIVQQLPRIQKILDSGDVIGESQIFNGKKLVLLRERYGETGEKERQICLEFDSDGMGELAGNFDRPYKQCGKILDARLNQTDGAAQKIKVDYTKEIFVTEKGQIIKMAAIVTTDPEITAHIEKQKQLKEQQDAAVAKSKKKTAKEELTRTHFISIISLKNLALEDPSVIDNEDLTKADFRVILFHCPDKTGKDNLMKNTQYCFVGDYLCHRQRNRRYVWVTKLTDSAVNEGEEQDISWQSYESKKLDISMLIKKSAIQDTIHQQAIQMTEVPKAYFTTLKSISAQSMQFYSNLMQITERNNGMIFDLDSMQEVDFIENIDQFQNPDNMINTGFIMSSATIVKQEDDEYLERKQIFTNEYVNLIISKSQIREEGKKRVTQINGMLFRTFSELDLFELKQLFDAKNDGHKIPNIDLQTIICTFEGHTIFSIFQEHISIYEKILFQLDNEEFASEETSSGEVAESGYLRRLHRILTLPTSDWKNTSVHRQRLQVETEEQNACKSFGIWLRMKFGMGDGIKHNGSIGFRSIRRKSLHFDSQRYRENLMEISMLTQENSIIDFVQNLEDIKILFTSMSPATVEFFSNAFNTTRFTNNIRNLDWRLGETLQVFSRQSSAITQNLADGILNEGQKKAEDSDEIQNRQVNAKMLSLDWLHGSYKGYEHAGFSDLIVELANAPHLSLFSTDLVVTLVEFFWDYYYKRIFFLCFVPYVLYFIATLVYVTQWAVVGSPEEGTEAVVAFILRWYIFISVFYFIFFEIVSISRDGVHYLYDVFNYFDWAAFVLNYYVIANSWIDEKVTYEFDVSEAGDGSEIVKETGVADRFTMRAVAMFLVILMWIKTFYWLRLFTATSFYIRLIQETLTDITYFLILFIFILMTFGTALLVMNQGRPEEKQIIDATYGNVPFINAIQNQYMLSLGEFSVETYQDEGGDVIIWMVFIITTFITQITFLNMLIAIMGDTFARVSEIKDQSARAEKIKILADYVVLVRNSKLDKDKYLFAIEPAQLGSDEQSSWEGSVTQMRKIIEKSMTSQQKDFTKKIANVSSQVSAVNSRIQSLEISFKELGSQQERLGSQQDRMPTIGDIELAMLKVIQGNSGYVDAVNVDAQYPTNVQETGQNLA